jgi:hypothetical protein
MMAGAVAIDSPAAIAAGWRPTTGPYAIGRATDTSLDLVPRAQHGGPNLHVSKVDARLGRDALDVGADVVISSDAITLAYAAAQATLSSVPLPWDRVYVLIAPGRFTRSPGDSAFAVKKDLATNALRIEARPASDSLWWRGLTCPTTSLSIQAPSGTSQASMARIVYDKRDDIARALSERLVGLSDARAPRLAVLDSALGSANSVRAAGLDTGAFRVALGNGRDLAYITALPLNPTNRCNELQIIGHLAPWLASIADTVGVRADIVPLVETRGRAIVRRQRVGLSIDGLGNMYLQFGPRPQS